MRKRERKRGRKYLKDVCKIKNMSEAVLQIINIMIDNFKLKMRLNKITLLS